MVKTDYVYIITFYYRWLFYTNLLTNIDSKYNIIVFYHFRKMMQFEYRNKRLSRYYKSAANLIIKNSTFNKSSKVNEWLGHGVYFYELIEKAQWWSKNKNEPVIIEAPISVQEDKLVNLDKPSEEDKFGSFIQSIEKQGGFVF